MDPIFRASAEVLVAATQLGTGRIPYGPDALRAELVALLQSMVASCRAAGVPDAETAEARYALVAFLDDRILRSSWAGRAEWMNNPLQLQLYREYAAGENFFARMRALLERPHDSPALRVYYLCLALGFTGATQNERDLRAFLEAARARMPAEGPLSPHAIPPDHYSQVVPRRPLVVALVACAALVSALGIGLLEWSLGQNLASTSRALSDAAAAHAPRGR